MAATSDKYSEETFNDKDTTSGGTTVKNIYALIPLALTEYLPASATKTYDQMTATEKKDDSGFKNWFCVHSVWHYQDKDGNDCVLGLLDPTNTSTIFNNVYGQNLNLLHATARKGKLRLMQGGITYNVLNDGGLNTKPWALVEQIHLCAQNALVFSAMYQNAYYINTTSYVAKLERLQYSQGSWQSTQTTYVNLDMNKTHKTKGDGVYFWIQDGMYALSPDVDDKIRVSIQCYNDETGAYGASGAAPYVTEAITATVTEALDLRVVWKIDELGQNPDTGDPYIVIMKEEYYAQIEDHDDPRRPTLYDLFEARGETATQEGVVVDCQITINGMEGTIPTGSILSSYLPTGMYYGFTKYWVGDYPEDGGFYNPADKTIFIRNQSIDSQPYKWSEVSYTPPPVFHWATLYDTDPIVPSIRLRGDSCVSYAIPDGAGYKVVIYPIVTVKAKDGSATVRVDIIRRTDRGESQQFPDIILRRENFPTDTFQEASMEFTSTNNFQTIEVPVADPYEESVPSTALQAVVDEIVPQLASHTYDYIVRVVSSEPSLDEEGSEETVYPIESERVSLEDLISG